MFARKRGNGKTFFQLFINEWKKLFIDVGKEFKKVMEKTKNKISGYNLRIRNYFNSKRS